MNQQKNLDNKFSIGEIIYIPANTNMFEYNLASESITDFIESRKPGLGVVIKKQNKDYCKIIVYHFDHKKIYQIWYRELYEYKKQI